MFVLLETEILRNSAICVETNVMSFSLQIIVCVFPHRMHYIL